MSMMDKSITAWGQNAPDWVKALAEACDATSLRKVAERLSVSPASISLAVGRKREKLDFIQDKVERVLMITTVACPVLGVIDKNECLQEQSRPFSAANPLRVMMYRACHGGCVHFYTKPKEKKQ